jgi:hypothetical protein
LVASWQSPVVQQLLTDDRVVLSGYARADALVTLYPFLTKLVVPRGVADFRRLAERMTVPEDKRILVELAQTWERLAGLRQKDITPEDLETL